MVTAVNDQNETLHLGLALRGLAKDSVIYGLSSGLARFVNLLMAPVLTRMFAPADYGVIALIQLATGVFVILAGMNLGSGIGYYYFQFEEEADRRRVLATGYVALVLIAVAICGGVALAAPQIAALLELRAGGGSVRGYDLAGYLRIAALGMFFSLLRTSFQSLLRILRQPFRFLGVEISALIGNVVCVLVLVVWLRQGIEGVFWAGVVAGVAGFLVGLVFVSGYLRGALSTATMGLILAYALPQIPAVLINWFQSQLGRFFINYYTTLAQQGLYSIALQITSLVVLVTTAFRMAYDPFSLSIMRRSNATSIYAQVYAVFIAGAGVLVGLLTIFARPALQVLTPEPYHSAYSMVFILATAALYMGANNILGTSIWLSKKTQYTSYAQVFVLITVAGLNLLLVPRFQAHGAAVAYLGGTFVQSFAYWRFSQRLYPIPYPYWKMQGFVAVILLLSLWHTLLVRKAGLVVELSLAVPFSIAVIFAGWFIGLSHIYRQMVRSVMRRWARHIAGRIQNRAKTKKV